MKVFVKSYPESNAIYLIETETGKVNLATSNMVFGKAVYGERLLEIEGKEYRLWDPYRSKLAAALLNGLSNMPIKPSCNVLYLGAASGTTVSHISDIVGIKGHVYAVDFSPRSFRELINNLSSRINVFPILADARSPYKYSLLMETVDVVYCDIAQPEQARILADNTDLFLKQKGSALLAIKARSIDSTSEPKKIFNDEINKLKCRLLTVKTVIPLEPYAKDHVMVSAEK